MGGEVEGALRSDGWTGGGWGVFWILHVNMNGGSGAGLSGLHSNSRMMRSLSG